MILKRIACTVLSTVGVSIGNISNCIRNKIDNFIYNIMNQRIFKATISVFYNKDNFFLCDSIELKIQITH